MFFDRRCPGCGVEARAICDSCWSITCTPPIAVDVPGLDGVSGVTSYDDRIGLIVVAAKNGGRRDILRVLARATADRATVDLASAERPVASVDVVTWVPASPSHRRERGFDQGRVLARSTAHRLGVPYRRLLTRRGNAQRGTNRSARLSGPDLVASGPCPSRVLVVDDVVTTGASLSRCAEELRGAGAQRVSGLAFALVARNKR